MDCGVVSENVFADVYINRLGKSKTSWSHYISSTTQTGKRKFSLKCTFRKGTKCILVKMPHLFVNCD
jgi:hypothetical protein